MSLSIDNDIFSRSLISFFVQHGVAMMETAILVINALVIGFAMGMAFSDWKTEKILFGPLEDDEPK